jgi:heme/copper-type cytochrome/quinol oxidase subunit 2
MVVWIVIIGVMVLAFLTKAIVKLRRRKVSHNYHPNINTRKKRFRFVNRFRHLEGLGD